MGDFKPAGNAASPTMGVGRTKSDLAVLRRRRASEETSDQNKGRREKDDRRRRVSRRLTGWQEYFFSYCYCCCWRKRRMDSSGSRAKQRGENARRRSWPESSRTRSILQTGMVEWTFQQSPRGPRPTSGLLRPRADNTSWWLTGCSPFFLFCSSRRSRSPCVCLLLSGI